MKSFPKSFAEKPEIFECHILECANLGSVQHDIETRQYSGNNSAMKDLYLGLDGPLRTTSRV